MNIQILQKRRKELGYTYQMVSEMSGIPLPTVQKVLGGFTKSPRFETMQALERVLSPGRDSRPTDGGTLPGGSAGGALDVMAGEPHGIYSHKEFDKDVMAGEPQAAYLVRGQRVRKPLQEDNRSCYPLLPNRRQGEYTAKDRDSLPEEVHTELIDGVIYDMASPKYTHQIIVTELLTQINAQIEKCGKDCLAFSAPTDVWLTKDDRNIFQPDIFVICDDRMLEEGGYITGAPPFIVEVLSPSTRSGDLLLKAYKYHEAGVREYWIVDPDEKRILVYNYDRDPDGTVNTAFSFLEDVPVGISGGKCSINLKRAKAILDRISGG